MKLNLSSPIATDQLTAILSSVGSGHLLQGTVYQPLMQLLIAPSQDSSNALLLWELTQKLYAHKEGEIDLTDEEVKLLKAKLDGVVFPWLKARLLDLFK